MRAEKDRLFHRNTLGRHEDVAAATDEEIRLLSGLFNMRMRELAEPPATPSWYKLYRHMDADGSGKISFTELVSMVRHELQLCSDELSVRQLKAVWLALDTDHSG